MTTLSVINSLVPAHRWQHQTFFLLAGYTNMPKMERTTKEWFLFCRILLIGSHEQPPFVAPHTAMLVPRSRGWAVIISTDPGVHAFPTKRTPAYELNRKQSKAKKSTEDDSDDI